MSPSPILDHEVLDPLELAVTKVGGEWRPAVRIPARQSFGTLLIEQDFHARPLADGQPYARPVRHSLGCARLRLLPA